MPRWVKYRPYWSKIRGKYTMPDGYAFDWLTGRMTGANMNLVTVNVKLGENDPEPEQKLEPVCHPQGAIGEVELTGRENIS